MVIFPHCSHTVQDIAHFSDTGTVEMVHVSQSRPHVDYDQ